MNATLAEIETMIDRLDPGDQALLLQYLAPRIASAMLSRNRTKSASSTPWADFRAVGDRVAATSRLGAPSLTEAVSEMRR